MSRLKTFFSTPGQSFRAPARILWTALIVRLLTITIGHTYKIRLILDHFQFGWEVGRIARALATGHGFADPFLGHSGPTTWIPPLYPLILAGVFKLTGIYTPLSAWLILALNSVFSCFTVAAVYEIAARCYDSRNPSRPTALWSAWLWALYPASIQYPVHWIWDMSLTAALFSWTLVLALRVRNIGEPQSPEALATAQTTKRWATFGLLWGILALTNPSLFLFLPACLLWMLWPTRTSLSFFTQTAAKALLACLLVPICLSPWIYRNWIVFHAFIPTRGNFGAELYQSTLEENDGFPWGPTLPLADAAPEFIRYKTMGELAYVREKTAAAHVEIHKHPRRIFDWTLKRVYFFWASVPHPFEKHPWVEIVRELNFGFLSVTGLLGLALSIRKRIPAAWLFAAAFAIIPAVYYFVTVQARFRHPIEPLICIVTVFLFRSAEPRRRSAA